MDAPSRKQLWMLGAILAIGMAGCRSTNNVAGLRLSSAESSPAEMTPHPSYAQTPPARTASTSPASKANQNFVATEQVSLQLEDKATPDYPSQVRLPETARPYSTTAYPYQSSGPGSMSQGGSASCAAGCSH